MKILISSTLVLFLLLFASSAMADRGYRDNNHDGYYGKGERIERHLDNKGNRIERHFDQKAAFAAERGNYRQALHFQAKGQQINHRMDRKGERLHARLDHRDCTHQRLPVHGYAPGASHLHHADYFSMMIRQPGFLFGWSGHR